MKISVVLPVFNEERTIQHIVERVLSASIGDVVEVIIVDDGSTDQTWDRVAELLHKHPQAEIKTFRLTPNQGKGAALRHGFAQVSGDIVVIQDADLEYSPVDIPKLIAPIIEGQADVVFGSRFLGGPHRALYYWHFVGNRLLTIICNMLTNINLSDMETGYKAFRRDVLAFLTIESNRFGFEPEFTIKMARQKLRIYEVPISYYGRSYEEGKKITWRDGLGALWTMVKYSLKR